MYLRQGHGDGPEAGTSGASEAARAPCRLKSPGVLPPPPRREFFLEILDILNAISCDLVYTLRCKCQYNGISFFVTY